MRDDFSAAPHQKPSQTALHLMSVVHVGAQSTCTWAELQQRGLEEIIQRFFLFK